MCDGEEEQEKKKDDQKRNFQVCFFELVKC